MSAETETVFDRAPSLSVWITAVAALVAVLVSGVTTEAAALGLLGLVAMPVGVSRGSRTVHTLGAVALFAGVLLAGSSGAGPAVVLVATAATVVAWDAGENAIGLGRQLGSAAETRRAELTHVGATTAVAAAVGALAYGTYRLARSGQPTMAVVLLLLAALLFAFLLDR